MGFPVRPRKKNAKPGTLARRRHFDRKRAELVAMLGGKCAECGSIKELTFDHIHGRTWDIKAVHATKRLRIYTQEAKDGKLQLLCLTCNSAKGQPDNDPFVPTEESEVPF